MASSTEYADLDPELACRMEALESVFSFRCRFPCKNFISTLVGYLQWGTLPLASQSCVIWTLPESPNITAHHPLSLDLLQPWCPPVSLAEHVLVLTPQSAEEGYPAI